jgi:TP901 family phage tail tape measure protein
MAAPIQLNANLNLNPASINASAKQVQQALGRITGQASEFQKSLDASTARVFAFGATTAVIAGVGTAFKKLIGTTITVQDELIKINAILGASAKDFGAFRDAIFNAAKSTGQSFQTVAAGAGELARQGLNAAETSKRLEAAMILTRVSGLGAEQSVKALTAAINGFQSAGLTAVDVTNRLVAVDTRFAVSAQDLADGFSRAGSTAEDAGVSFNQLLGLITAVEQKTARGGAVIGNAFKSIFTRLSRGKTIDQLQQLGVEIDASQSGVQKLEALSNALEKISDPTKASAIKELAGGVFQINVVSAALKDLSSETSIFAKATDAAANAGNDAFERNAELSKSLASQINLLVVSVTDFAEKVGSITFGPLLEDLISVASKASDVLGNALTADTIGGKFIAGFFKVVGKFIAGPGLVLITKAFFNIFRMVTKFAAEGFKSVMAMGSQAEKVKSIESGIVDLLGKDAKLRAVLNSKTATQAQKEQAVINAIKAENRLLVQQQLILTNIANVASRRGVAGYDAGKGFTGKGGKKFAAGFQQEEATAMMLGASPNVSAHYGKGTIGGQRFIMNDQEKEIPNFGSNGDSAVIPMYARGYPVGNPAGYARGRPRKIKQLNADERYGMIVAESGSKTTQDLFISQTSRGISATKGAGDNSVAKVTVPTYRLNNSKAKGGMNKHRNSLVRKYTDLFTSDSITMAKMISGGEMPDPVRAKDIKKTLNAGSAKSSIGSVFESGVGALLSTDDFKDFQNRAAGSLMDFKGNSLTNLKGGVNPFNIPPSTVGIEAKHSSSLAGGAAEKIYKILGAPVTAAEKRNKIKPSERERRRAFQQKGKAAGHIPRYAAGTTNVNSRRHRARRFVGNSRLSQDFMQLGQGVSSGVNRVKDSGVGRRISSATQNNQKFMQNEGSGFKMMAMSMALSGAASGLDSLAASAKEAGNETGALAANTGSAAAQTASMGAMFGPLGAGIGAAVGALGSLTMAVFEQRKAMHQAKADLETTNEVISNRQGGMARERAARKEFGFISGDSIFKEAQKQQEAGMGDRTKDITRLQTILNTSQSIQELDDASDQLVKVYKEVGEAMSIRRNIEDLEKSIDATTKRLKSVQLAAGEKISKFKSDIFNQQVMNTAGSSLLGSMKGPQAASLQRQLSTNSDILGVSNAQAGLQEAKLDESNLVVGSEEQIKAAQATRQASDSFKAKIVAAATNMQVRMNAITDRTEAIRIEGEQNRMEMVRNSFSGLASSFTSGKFDIGNAIGIGKQIAAERDPQRKAQMAAELEAEMDAKGVAQAVRDIVLKASGVSSKSMADATMTNQFENVPKNLRGKIRGTFNKEGNKKAAELDAEAEVLKAELEALKKKFKKLNTNFNVDGVVASIADLNKNLSDASSNLSSFASATNSVTSIASKVTKATADISTLTDMNIVVIDKLKTRIETLESELESIKPKE